MMVLVPTIVHREVMTQNGPGTAPGSQRVFGAKGVGNWIELPLSLSRCEGSLDNGKRQNGKSVKIFGLLDGPRNPAAPNDLHHGIGNPLSGMIADPDRHARNSLLATCGTAARHFPQDLESWTHTNKGRRWGKRREEDNFPASRGNERETELTLPYGYPSCGEEERN
jgi:hypothetical protein